MSTSAMFSLDSLPAKPSKTAWPIPRVAREAGKTLIIKYMTASEPHPDGTRTLFFELNGQPRELGLIPAIQHFIE